MSDSLVILSIIINGLFFIGGFLLSLWWVYVPLFLLFLTKSLWLSHSRQRFINDMDWILLEVIPPREIQKTPRAMEQFFAGLHGGHGPPNWKNVNIEGYTQRWFSMEIVSLGGEIHFFVRTVSRFRDLIESNIYAQYPEAEIVQVDDYVQSVSQEAIGHSHDLYGTELILAKDDAYPIRTYLDFEKGVMTEEQRIDPMASILEVMSKINDGEQVWIQTLVRPVDDSWKKQGEELRDKLVGREKVKKQGFIKKEAAAWKEAGKEQSQRLIAGQAFESASDDPFSSDSPFLWTTTKAEQDVIHAIEENISKIGFETLIRFVYFAPKDAFDKPIVSSIIGFYKQFGTQNLNAIKPNGRVGPDINYAYEGKTGRNLYRKKRVLAEYKKRYFPQYSTAISYLKLGLFERLPIVSWFFLRSKPFVFNIEELATIYHYPATTVKAPLTPKVEAKKGEPPIGLPVE